MAQEPVQRRLVAILAADVVGYSRLVGADEEGTIARLKDLRTTLIDPKIAEHGGRIVKTTGDGILIEFDSAVAAVRNAVEVQQAMDLRNVDVPDEQRITFRVGINVGDIIVDGDDILGDGVNIAARLEGIAEPGGVCISSTVFDHIDGKLDYNFEDIGEPALKNIDRTIRVYQLATHDTNVAGPATLDSGEASGSSDKSKTSEGAAATLPLTDKPSIAVMPFDNMSGDPEQEYFADGIAEDIITALGRFHWFFVIARSSSFSYKGTSPDVRQVGNDLGVRYVVQGSVRKLGNRARVSAQLVEATTGRHVWAERYDRSLEDIFALQDEISEAITTMVAPAFLSAEAQRAGRKPPENLDAWDLAMRGNWYLARHGKDYNAEARRLFERALRADPNSTMALSGLAFALCWVNLFGWEDDLETVRNRAHEAARRAVDLDDNDSWAHAALGWVRFSLRQLDGAVTECRRALELNPSLALAASVLAIAYSWRSDNDDSLEHAMLAEKLSPRDPGQSMWCFARTAAEFGFGHYEESIKWAERTLQNMPEFPGAWRYLAASLAHLGRFDEARTAVRQLLAILPKDNLRLVSTAFPARRPERLEQFVGGLRKAGLPEQSCDF